MSASISEPVAPVNDRPDIPGLLWLLGALTAIGPLSMDMYVPGLPGLTRNLHASASAGQLTLTGCMLGMGLGQLVGGPICDARGRRGPLLAGMIAYLLTTLACVLPTSVWILLALRTLEGIAGGFGIVIARAVVRDVYGGVAASKAFATLMVVNGVAPVLAPLIGGQVLRVTDWRGIFVVLSALGVPMLAAIVRMLPETLAPERRHSGGLRAVLRTFWRLLRDRRFSPYALSYSISFGAMFAYISGSSFVLENVF
ncbi:MAG TPA: Bcr/CflA family efflux MFS transporter, partial [Solirubrobacteraceae bacterium]|nr:Bcr/CflA family efflux MFS transporter [Solirubrobacteraceae bacterium]